MSILKISVRLDSTHISTVDVCFALLSRLAYMFVCLFLLTRRVKPCLSMARVNFWLPLFVSSPDILGNYCCCASLNVVVRRLGNCHKRNSIRFVIVESKESMHHSFSIFISEFISCSYDAGERMMIGSSLWWRIDQLESEIVTPLFIPHQPRSSLKSFQHN